jgi:hypothetical protein
LFRLRGLSETEAVVPPGNEKRIDLWFVPENNERTVEAPVFTGVLAEMAADSAAIELWSAAPSGDHFHKALGKREAWHDILELRDKRPCERPPLWHICAGKPVKVIGEFGLEATSIPGRYRPRSPGWRVFVVVLGELPATRDTILLRLLGRGRVRRDALRELRNLPDGAWEKPLAQEWIMRLGLEAPSNAAVVPEEREFFMDVHAWYKEFCEEQKRAGREQAMLEFEPRLAAERRQAEVNPLAHLVERRLGRSLAVNEREVLVARVKIQGADRIVDLILDLSAPDLVAWLEQDKLAR